MLLKIAELIKHTVSDGAKFISVDNNKSIVEDLLYDNKNVPDNSIDITSIDCHHCLISSDAELQKIYDFGEYNSLSWIGYLFSRNKVGNYMWITAPCSTSADIDKLQSLFSFEKKSINTVNLLEDNFDKVYFAVVAGNHSRISKKDDTYFKRNTASMFYKIIGKWSNKVKISENVGHFRLMSRRVVDQVIALNDYVKVLRVEVPYVGFKTTEVEFVRAPRNAGKTHYNLKSM